MLWATAALAALWVGYALAGRQWRIAPRLDTRVPAPGPVVAGAQAPSRPASVVAVVPARNEAAELPATLGALLAQRHPALHVILVDDDSHDGTAAVARRVAEVHGLPDRLTVLAGAPLAAGWTGKVWAQHQGVAAAAARGTEWIWLTDADIHHAPDVLEGLLAIAAHERRDLVSVMARLRCATGFERLLIPAFTYFFAMIYGFDATADDRSRTAGAAGGCILVRRALLERAGGMAAIRDAVIDDCALAAACKRAGGRLRLGYHAGVESTRGYATLTAIWDMVARSAYTQLGRSPLVLAGCVLGLAYVFLLPIAALLVGTGWTRGAALAAYAAMVWTYAPMVRYLGCPPGWALALPVSAALYTAMTVSSAWRHHRGRGAAWKGRAYGATSPALAHTTPDSASRDSAAASMPSQST